MSAVDISFIIPAFNEEYSLPHTIECIEEYAPEALSYEIIVADNGSEDKTVQIATKYAKVVVDNKATIGGLRNLAVQESNGCVLVFLDADISLTNTWKNNFTATYEMLLANSYYVTGSRCSIPTMASWIEKVWFKPLLMQQSTYINSGHLITTKKLFEHIGGFNSELETGEDYAFGQSAREANASIVNNPLLEVVHEGYPKSLTDFIKREIWHGKGDCESLKVFLSSKVALVSIIFFLLHAASILSFISGAYMAAITLLLFILFIPLLAAVVKHKVYKLRNVMQVGFLYYFYLFSRSLSCIPLLNKRTHR